MKVALTGNIGCGKSSVARMLGDLGATVIDADRLVHEMLAEGGEAVAAVLAEFPEAAAAGGRAVDRKALAAIVFADPERRGTLERLIHPRVWRREKDLSDAAFASGARLVVVEATMLFEAWRAGGPDPRDRFDAVIVVTCRPDVQLERLRARGVSEQDARARMAAQMPQDEKARLADHVIDNSSDLEATREQARLLHSRLLPGSSR